MPSPSLLSLALGALAVSAASPSTTADCIALAKPALASGNASFINATFYPALSLNVSDVFNSFSFCEVYASIAYGPAGNDTLNFATWLPDASHYQGRFIAVGNGGMAGTIDYQGMMAQLNAGLGFAVAGGDAGHSALLNNLGVGLPGVYLPYLHDQAQVLAWIHNAISLFTPYAQDFVEAFYSAPPSYNYYYGCSTGGAQGFALAQFNPDLFDGIYAGSPGNWYSHLTLSFLWNAQHTNTTNTSLSQDDLNFITQNVLNQCDTIDGVADRLLEDPLKCDFDINSLNCNVQNRNSTPYNLVTCLTTAQIDAMKAIYGGPVRSDTGSEIYPGFSFGSETELLLQEGGLADVFSIPILQNLVYNNLAYDANTFNYASDVDTVDSKAGTYIDEITPNLSTFKGNGGRMISTQGWADPLDAALWPLQHLDQLQTYFGNNVSDFYELFMVPGGGHCGSANNYPSVPATYEVAPALVAWVEKGQVPGSILSTDPPDNSNRTRLLCPWPKTAVYEGGDVNNADSYVCG